MLCQNIKEIQLMYKKIFKKTYATTGLKWLVVYLRLPTTSRLKEVMNYDSADEVLDNGKNDNRTNE